jgi:peptide/nickel transport system ATP-binding protein
MIVMEEGRITETGMTEQVLANPQSNATRILIAAVPRL